MTFLCSSCLASLIHFLWFVVSHIFTVFVTKKAQREWRDFKLLLQPWHERKGFAIHHLMPSNSTIKPLGTHCMSHWNWFKISLNETEIFFQTPFVESFFPAVTGLHFNQISTHQIFYAFMMRAIQSDVYMLYHYIFYSCEKREFFFVQNFNQI